MIVQFYSNQLLPISIAFRLAEHSKLPAAIIFTQIATVSYRNQLYNDKHLFQSVLITDKSKFDICLNNFFAHEILNGSSFCFLSNKCYHFLYKTYISLFSRKFYICW